jgi:release factor glutamine methyltransferase
MTLDKLMALAKDLANKFSMPLTDYQFVLSYHLQQSLPQMLINRMQDIPDGLEQALNHDFAKLNQGIPPQYVLGKAWFYGLELLVTPAVLIPRPETEGLVELVLARLQGQEKILDIGSGSGAIAIAIKTNCPSAHLDATELSVEALVVAQNNADRHNVQINFHHNDLWPDSAILYDWIVSNPPYISAEEMQQLDSRVKDYEPVTALLGGIDGLDYYRKILCQAKSHLKPGGTIALEHGAGQQEVISHLANLQGWHNVQCFSDLAGLARYLLIK